VNKSLIYITYQSFPAHTANSLQTMTHLNYFANEDLDVKLIFPLRNKESSSNIAELSKFYKFNSNIEIHGTIHPLPFKKIQILEKYMYIFSHYLWSYFTVERYYRKNKNSFFFTRSEWVFYFLSKKKMNVIYECHQLSKNKKKLIKKSLSNKNSKVVYLTKEMSDELKGVSNENSHVIPSGFDENIFKIIPEIKKEKKIIYSGSMLRFGESRGLEKIIDYFHDPFFENFKLLIVSNDLSKEQFENKFNCNIDSPNIEYIEKIDSLDLAKLINSCSIGLLINNKSEHAERFTSPLKYFEYIACGLKVLSTNSVAHNELPFQENIYYFDLNNFEEFKYLITGLFDSSETLNQNVDDYSMSSRINKIIDIYK